ncbi:hypothetical protein JXA80_06450 [bacterium]|nr:hypothetical protein [candidate division CSSED10-310 bacterium]
MQTSRISFSGNIDELSIYCPYPSFIESAVCELGRPGPETIISIQCNPDPATSIETCKIRIDRWYQNMRLLELLQLLNTAPAKASSPHATAMAEGSKDLMVTMDPPG